VPTTAALAGQRDRRRGQDDDPHDRDHQARAERDPQPSRIRSPSSTIPTRPGASTSVVAKTAVTPDRLPMPSAREYVVIPMIQNRPIR